MTIQNFYWLFEGSLAGSARPGGDIGRLGPARAGQTFAHSLDVDLRWLKRQGIGAILSLTETPLSTQALAQHDMRSLHLPIDDQTAPLPEDFLAALDFIDQQHIQRRGVLVHCRIGDGRTGCILAAYLIRQGASPQQALARLRAIRPDSVSAPSQQEALTRFASRCDWIL